MGELKVKSIDWIECMMKNRDKGLLTWKDEGMFTEWKKTDKGAVERKINRYTKKVQELFLTSRPYHDGKVSGLGWRSRVCDT